MMRERPLKESTEGEALLLAHDRLMGSAEKHKILLVISEGAPADCSTLLGNVGNSPDKHLREVIVHVEDVSTANVPLSRQRL